MDSQCFLRNAFCRLPKSSFQSVSRVHWIRCDASPGKLLRCHVLNENVAALVFHTVDVLSENVAGEIRSACFLAVDVTDKRDRIVSI